MKKQEKIKKIADYIKAGEKKLEDFTIGVEMENFIINKDDLKTVSYYGENGVGETLEYLTTKGFIPYKEGEYVLGLEKGDLTISTEPGSQFEVAIKSNTDIKNLENKFKCFFNELVPYLNSKNQVLVSLGYHPNMKIDEIKILPKKRYDYMYDYFKNKGNMAHNMMKGTASLQVTIDYLNEDDFRRKYFLANVLTPIFYGLFDNTYIFEKEPLEIYTIRQKIWENTDKERSGLFDIAFDESISYEKYAEKILNTPPIFIEKNGEYIYTKNRTLEDIADEYQLDESLIFQALSIVFPDVRVKTYIEMRMFDSIPYPLNFAAVALIKGLFYNDNNLKEMCKMSKGTSYKEAIEGKEEVQKHGINAVYLNKTILEHGKFLIELASKGLDEDERNYLKPLKTLIDSGKTPRDKFEEIYIKEGLNTAVNSVVLKMEN
ncbi:glutamate--cysteine ligase [Miniphocaeibacter halophilus]|uniref:Glutamate--cysteine ligase n=1 Tax=Miniphocaeibacter halophilus TaxID=2931922 RepID=A0AC61N196_9FIRM|nr:glutamate-cysteine ligase family protein [Miniphocaeibacter halophilus]QQK08869.1 glutamate--cysteine ligase [Miniphocaeibacter halophilus]